MNTEDVIDKAEEALGENIQWLRDQFDLHVRRGDTDVIRRLDQLENAWKELAKMKFGRAK